MDPEEDLIYSFIIKIWIEETVEEAGQARWRGHITHVGSGNRRYLKSPCDVVDFVAAYLKPVGVRFGRCLIGGRLLATVINQLYRLFPRY